MCFYLVFVCGWSVLGVGVVFDFRSERKFSSIVVKVKNGKGELIF